MTRYGMLGLGMVTAAAGMAVSLAAMPAAAEETPARLKAVKIGLIGSLFRDTPEPLFQVMMRPLKALMEAQTGISGQLVSGGDARALGRQLAEDKVQLGVFHGVEFAWARLKHPELKPLCIAVNKHPKLHAHVVVRHDSPAAKLDDLKGKAVAVPKFNREHCLLFLDRRCVACGDCTDKYFAQVTRPAGPEEALDQVVDGAVQATVVDAVAFEAYQALKPGRFKKLKSIQQSEAFPAAVVAYQPGSLDDATLRRFREGMVTARQNARSRQLLELCRITSFENVPADYEQVLADILKAYPPADDAK